MKEDEPKLPPPDQDSNSGSLVCEPYTLTTIRFGMKQTQWEIYQLVYSSVVGRINMFMLVFIIQAVVRTNTLNYAK